MSDKNQARNNLIKEIDATIKIYDNTTKGWSGSEIQYLVKDLKVENPGAIHLTRFLQNLALSQQASMRSLVRISDALSVILQDDHKQETNNEGSKD